MGESDHLAEPWPKHLSHDDFLALVAELPAAELNRLLPVWFERGDGAAIYQNNDLGHPEAGDVVIASYGSPLAQLEVADTPPWRLPDGLRGGQVNWRYILQGVYGKDD